MDKSMAIMELVSNYDVYADVDELNITAAADAPATSPVCAVSAASSLACAASVRTVSQATFRAGC
ncbi:LxmA leader domain family RiPP [Streptomyces sp. NPDC015345]|uniref:LxmA leader domain family RiPP n=1 Tax=Streptomyces sp. NPDC015345 TaxID=3364953 RepID=UPI0036F97053